MHFHVKVHIKENGQMLNNKVRVVTYFETWVSIFEIFDEFYTYLMLSVYKVFHTNAMDHFISPFLLACYEIPNLNYSFPKFHPPQKVHFMAHFSFF